MSLPGEEQGSAGRIPPVRSGLVAGSSVGDGGNERKTSSDDEGEDEKESLPGPLRYVKRSGVLSTWISGGHLKRVIEAGSFEGDGSSKGWELESIAAAKAGFNVGKHHQAMDRERKRYGRREEDVMNSERHYGRHNSR
jgi:hypothetical protein